MVRESLEPGQSVSFVARRNGINANQLFLLCCRRRRIDPVGEISLTQSVPREPLPLLNLCRFGGGS